MSEIRVSQLPLAGEFDRYSDVLVGNVDNVTHRIPGELIGGEGLVTEPFTDAGSEDGGVWSRELAEADHGKLLHHDTGDAPKVVVPLLSIGWTVTIVAVFGTEDVFEIDASASYTHVRGPTEFRVGEDGSPVAVTLVVSGTELDPVLQVVGSGAEPLPNEQSGSYTLELSDANRVLVLTSDSSNNMVFIPTNANVPIPIGSVVAIIRKGSATTQVQASTGVTLNGEEGLVVNIPDQYQSAALTKLGTNDWVMSGSVEVAI